MLLIAGYRLLLRRHYQPFSSIVPVPSTFSLVEVVGMSSHANLVKVLSLNALVYM